jgi:hypothetical protein
LRRCRRLALVDVREALLRAVSREVQAQLTRLTQARIFLGRDARTCMTYTTLPELSRHPHLTKLHIGSHSLSPRCVDTAGLGRQIAALTALQHLECNCVALRWLAAETVEFAQQLATLSGLRCLSLRSLDLGWRFAGEFASAASGMTALAALDVSGNSISLLHSPPDAAGPDCGDLLAALPRLTRLHLSDCDVERSSAARLATWLRNVPLLQHLDLAGSIVPSTECPWTIHNTRAARHGTCDCCAVLLAPQLGALTLLATLDLEGTRVGVRGAAALAAHLARLVHLKPREWAQQGMASGGAGMYRQGACDPRHLTHHGWPKAVEFSGVHVSSEAVAAIEAGMTA